MSQGQPFAYSRRVRGRASLMDLSRNNPSPTQDKITRLTPWATTFRRIVASALSMRAEGFHSLGERQQSPVLASGLRLEEC